MNENLTGGKTPYQVAAKKPFVAKGHDAILKRAQDDRGHISIALMSDGSQIDGRLVARDKFTITVDVLGTGRVTVYKHAIESFTVIDTPTTKVQ